MKSISQMKINMELKLSLHSSGKSLSIMDSGEPLINNLSNLKKFNSLVLVTHLKMQEDILSQRDS